MNNQSILVENVPIDWVIKKIKYVFDERKETNDPIQTDVLVSLTHDRGVILHSEKGDIGNKKKDDIKKYKIVHPGDIVVNSMNVIIGSSGLSDHFGLVSPVYYMLVKKDSNHDNKFFHYLFRSIVFQKSLIGVGNGILEHRMRVPIDKLGGHLIPLPSANEQKLISQYLDKKTSQIDSLVEKIQKKIELLKEQRTSLINHYVTKGLDPNVEMKDSGVEWIGEIPRHWKTLRLCNFGLFSKGKNITKGDLVETGKPVILYSHLYTTYSRTVKEPKFFISDDLEENSTKIFKNTFLFTSSGESKEDIGKCILYLGNETSVGGDQVIFKLKSTCDFDPEFLSFSFNSDLCVNQKSSNSRGEIVVHIYEKQLRDVVVPIPPENEQISIRNKLQEVERNSDEIIRNLKHKIELLKEYRQSLISSVVTGKVRVTEDIT